MSKQLIPQTNRTRKARDETVSEETHHPRTDLQARVVRALFLQKQIEQRRIRTASILDKYLVGEAPDARAIIDEAKGEAR